MDRLHTLGTIFDKVTLSLAIAAGVLIVFLMLAVSSDVLMRYLFNSPIPTMQDIAQQALLLMTFLSATWILKLEGHTTVGIILSRLDPRTQCVLNFGTSILSALICLVFCWYGAKVTMVDFQRHALVTTELRIPYAYIFIYKGLVIAASMQEAAA